MEKLHGHTLEYWKNNAEEDYFQVPISVLKYITCLEERIEQLTIANVVDSKPEIKAALNHAVSAIYFNDNSDYLSGLYRTVSSLTGLEAPTDDDITNLFKRQKIKIELLTSCL